MVYDKYVGLQSRDYKVKTHKANIKNIKLDKHDYCKSY